MQGCTTKNISLAKVASLWFAKKGLSGQRQIAPPSSIDNNCNIYSRRTEKKN
jgi:hypothetical protein